MTHPFFFFLFRKESGALQQGKKVGTSRGLACLSRTRPLTPSHSLSLSHSLALFRSLFLSLARALVPSRSLALSRRQRVVVILPVCFSVFGVEAIVYPGMSLAGDVDLTISPLPRTAASCTTHWRLPRRFQSVVNPTRIATSSFVGHFSGRRTRARERATRHRAAGTRNRVGRYGGRVVNRVTFPSRVLTPRTRTPGTGRRRTNVRVSSRARRVNETRRVSLTPHCVR